MLPDINAATDINLLPYFVINALTGERQRVYFAPLLPEDEAELRGPDWSRAVYRDVWIAFADDGQTFKLLCIEGSPGEILGLARIGIMKKSDKFLRKSLVESAPSNRTGAGLQKFAGVGRALVARIVAESFRIGGQGRIIVEPRPGSEFFHTRLGFQKRNAKEWQLGEVDAAILLALVLREAG